MYHNVLCAYFCGNYQIVIICNKKQIINFSNNIIGHLQTKTPIYYLTIYCSEGLTFTA
jgi:hypothetical protein